MKNLRKKLRYFISFITVFIMLFVGIASPNYVHAATRDELFKYWNLRYDQDLESYIDSLICHEGVLSHELDQDTILLYEQYIRYIGSDATYIVFDTSQLENEKIAMLESNYPQVLSTFGNIYAPEFEYSQMTIDDRAYLRELLLSNSDGVSAATIEYEIASLEMVRRNVSMLNALVDEGAGTIDSNGNFSFDDTDSEEDLVDVFNEDNNIVDPAFDHTRFTWFFNVVHFSWRGFSLNLGSGIALVFSLFCIFSYLSANIVAPIQAFQTLSRDDAIANLITELMVQIPNDLAAGLVGLKSYGVLATLTNLLSIFLTITSSLSFTLKVITVAISLCLPSVVDCALVLYNAMTFYKGANLSYNWNVSSHWKYWGISFVPIEEGV